MSANLVETRPGIGKLALPRPLRPTERELYGGLHAIAVPHTSVPLVEIRLTFPLGGAEMQHSERALVLSEALFAGTEKHDRKQLAEAVERLGGGFGASVAGDRVELQAYALAPKLGELLGLIDELLSSSTYPTDEVKAERARKADELLIALSRPELLADEAMGKRLFGRHPYGAAVPRPQSLVRLSAASLRRLHDDLFVPKAAQLVIVGDTKASRALSTAEERLGPWLASRRKVSSRIESPPPIVPGGIGILDRRPSVQSVIRMGAAAPSRASADWPALSLANEILGGMFTSRLTENLREKHGYTYSPRSRVLHSRLASTFHFGAEVGTEVTGASLVEVQYELGRLVTKGITEEELEAARRHHVGALLFQMASQSGLASTIAALVSTGSDVGYVDRFLKGLLRSTKADVEGAARRWLSPAAMATVVVGDAGAVFDSLSSLGEVWEI